MARISSLTEIPAQAYLLFFKDSFLNVDHFFTSNELICHNTASSPRPWFFGHKARGTSVPWPGIKPAPAALEDRFPTTRPPGKAHIYFVMSFEVEKTIPLASLYIEKWSQTDGRLCGVWMPLVF